MGHLREGRRERKSRDLLVLPGGQEDHTCHHRLHGQHKSSLRSRRQIPLLPFGAGLQRGPRRFRFRVRESEGDSRLCGHSPRRHAFTLCAEERRSRSEETQSRRKGRGQTVRDGKEARERNEGSNKESGRAGGEKGRGKEAGGKERTVPHQSRRHSGSHRRSAHSGREHDVTPRLEGLVFYITTPIIGLSGPLSGEGFALHIFDMKERKDAVLINGVTAYALSFDGKKVLYSAPPSGGGGGGGSDDPVAKTYGIIDATPPSAGPHHVGEGALALGGMQTEIDPRAEWEQMFDEVYRQERDYFFEASMNGVDWAKQRDKYAQLLPYVADRYDLTYILGEFIGELSYSHTYVGGGDYPNLHPVNVGLLGVDFEADSANGLYRFKKIYPGENWDNALRSPLTEPGVSVKTGEYLLS